MGDENPNGGCAPQTPVCLEFKPELNAFILTNQFGGEKPVPFNIKDVAALGGEIVIVDGVCQLRLYLNKELCATIPLTNLLEKMDLTPALKQDPDTCELIICIGGKEAKISMAPILQQIATSYSAQDHSIVNTLKGVPLGVPQQINCGAVDIRFNDATNVCELLYTNAKNQLTRKTLPINSFSHDAAACTLTITNPQQGKPDWVIPTGIGVDQVKNKIKLCFDDACNLVLNYKGVECALPMPDFLISAYVDPANCTFVSQTWKGDPVVVPYLDAITLEKNDDGTALLSIKGLSCVIEPATPPDGFSLLGLVNADGEDDRGNTVLDFQGNPIDPNTQVINYYDPDGAYLYSKDCTRLFSAVTSVDGTVSITPTTGPDGAPVFDLSVNIPTKEDFVAGFNPQETIPDTAEFLYRTVAGNCRRGVLPKAKNCAGENLDRDAVVWTPEEGGLSVRSGASGARANNPQFVDPECLPDLPDWPDVDGITDSRDGIDFFTRNGEWWISNAASCPRSGFDTAPTPTFSDADLAALFEENGTDVDIVIATRTLCFENLDCLRAYSTWRYRWSPATVLTNPSGIKMNVKVDAASDLPATHFSGQPTTDYRAKCLLPNCAEEFAYPPIHGHSITPRLNTPQSGNNPKQTAIVNACIRFVEDYVPDPRHTVGAAVFSISYDAYRDTRIICP